MALLFTAELSREELLEWLHGPDPGKYALAGCLFLLLCFCFSRFNVALAWLVRIRSIAIGMRTDVDWRGQVHFDEAHADARRTELHERWRASRLFHWQRDAANNDAVWNEVRQQLVDQAELAGGKQRDAPIEIVAQAPLDAVERLVGASLLSSSKQAAAKYEYYFIVQDCQ